jgi:glycerol uptake facilitator protein
MNAFLAEFFGTAIIIVFGGGVVSNVVLNKTKGFNSGWIVITSGWAVGVFTGVLIAAPYSGAHLNPAITIALVMAHKFSISLLPLYIFAIKNILMPQMMVMQNLRFSALPQV